MRMIMRLLVTITAVLLCSIVASACGGSDVSTQSQGQVDESDDDNGNGAPGIPGGDSDDEAAGAPINIPSFQQDQGRPLEEVLAEIESGVRDQCDGELCLELRVERSDSNFTECRFVRTDPLQGSEVERGTTVVVIAGTLPCEDEQPDTGDGSTEEPTEEDQ